MNPTAREVQVTDFITAGLGNISDGCERMQTKHWLWLNLRLALTFGPTRYGVTFGYRFERDMKRH